MATPGVVLNGLSLNGLESSGVKWTLDKFEGWAGSPASSIQVERKPRASGGWAGTGYLVPRHIVAEGYVRAPTEALLEDAFNRLKVATTLTTGVLMVTEAAQTRSANVRREDGVGISYVTPTIGRWSIQLVAPDPRTFGTTLSGSTLLPVVSGGLTVPFTVPFSINSTIVSGQVSLTNPGNIAGPVTLRIDGPVTGPIMTHVSTGRALVFATTLVLGVGEWIEVNMERHEVLANGQSSRNGWVTSRGWSQFEPGANTWSFQATSYDPGSMLTVAASPAWE